MSEVDERLYQAVHEDDTSAALKALDDGASANYEYRESGSGWAYIFPVLYVACKNKNRQLVELLLARGANPSADYSHRAWGSESTPCLLAAIPSIGIVKALLEKGADPNIPACSMGSNLTTALQAASGNQELIDLLKQYGAKHTQGEFDGRLYQAVQQDDVHAAHAALEQGASADYMHRERGSGWTAMSPMIYVACKNKNKQMVELLLARGANPNAEYSTGAQGAPWEIETSCLWAAIPSIEIVRALLEKGADPKIPAKTFQWSAPRGVLQAASGNQELIDLLKQYGAKHLKSEFDVRLYQAVQQNDLKAAVAALEAGASADYTHREDGHLFPVLYVACKEQNKEMVDLLLARGADVNVEAEGRSCLLAAIPSIDIVKALLEKGADPNDPAGSWLVNHTSALHAASGNRGLIDLLKQYGAKHIKRDFDERLYQAVQQEDVHAALAALENGASANYVHREGDSTYTDSFPVLYVACSKKNRQLVDLLLARDADANAEYSQRSTWGSEREPCLLAAIPHIGIVRALLEKGADPNIPACWREAFSHETTALERASGNQELIELLRQYGAR